MQDKTWYSILGLDAEPLFLQDTMLKSLSVLKIYFELADGLGIHLTFMKFLSTLNNLHSSLPVVPVKYCRQSFGGVFLELQLC